MTQTQAMETLIAGMIAKALAGANGSRKVKAKGRKGKGRTKLTDAEKAAFIAKNDAECVVAFNEAGYEDVQPRVNVLTYDKWISAGRRVKKGESSVKVGPFSLFHRDQTEALGVEAAAPATATVQ